MMTARWFHLSIWLWLGVSFVTEGREMVRKPLPTSSMHMVVESDLPDAQWLNHMMTLSVSLQPVSPGTAWKLVAFEARMPEHNHGMGVVPKIQEKGAQIWSISFVKLHMAGRWVLSFTFENGTQKQVITQDLILR